MRSRHLLATLLLSLLLSLPVATGWSTEAGRPRAPDGGSGILLVDCAGTYLRIAIENTSLQLADEGLIWDAPEAWNARFHGCLVPDAASIPDGKYLYVVVARGPFYDAADSRDYRVASLRVPSLDVVSYVDLPDVVDGQVSVLLSPDASQVQVWHTTTSGARALRLPISDGRFAGSSGKEPDVVEQAVSDTAYWSGKDRIIDGSVVLDERGRKVRRVNPYASFGSWAHTAFPDLVRKGTKGAPFLQLSRADSAADRMLFVVNPDRRSGPGPLGGGLVVFDLQSGKTTAIRLPMRPTALDPFSTATPTARLTPDGTRVVLEETEYEHEEGFRRRTGTIRIYDADSGHLLSTVFLADQPGFSGNERIAGFAQREQLMFYGNGEKIFVIDLVHGVLRATLTPEIEFDPQAAIGVVSYGPGS